MEIKFWRRPATLDAVLRFASLVFGSGFLLAYVWFSQPPIAYFGLAAAVALISIAVLPWRILRRWRVLLVLLGLAWSVDIVLREVPRMAGRGWTIEDMAILLLPVTLYGRAVWLSYFPSSREDKDDVDISVK